MFFVIGSKIANSKIVEVVLEVSSVKKVVKRHSTNTIKMGW